MKIFFSFLSVFSSVSTCNSCLMVVCFAVLCIGCHSRKLPDVPQVSATADTLFSEEGDFHVDLLLIDSIHITFADDLQTDTFMHEKDWNTLAEHMITCRYDTFRNQSDVHVTMVPPDYTVCIKYKEMPADHKEWLLIWEQAGLAKYRNLWFHLPEASRSPVSNLFNRYKQ